MLAYGNRSCGGGREGVVVAGGTRERGRMKSERDVQGSTSCIGILL